MSPIRKSFFNSPLEQRFFDVYRKLFSIAEIESRIILQWVFGATILSYFLTFGSWIGNTSTTVDAVARGTYVCWPYFQSCADWIFLRALPYGYSQTTLYMMLFGALLAAVYAIYHRDWVLAHLLLIPAFVWHIWVSMFISYTIGGNYDYYLMVFALILLFLPHKEFFLKLTLVLFYVLSTVAKIHPSWVMGLYFSALKTGLPLFPDWSIPALTNLVIAMEMVGAWFLLSTRKYLQRAALTFFAIFHLYSGILVEYRYPATVLPTLLILFGPMYRHTPAPLDRRSVAGWMLVALLFFAQFSPVMIPGDEKLTNEGNRFGLYMFEANHQCVSTVHVTYPNGMTEEFRQESNVARFRCEPYRYWFRINQSCATKDPSQRFSWTFDHSINGGPFLRIVDVDDACSLSYQPFTRNMWIKTEKDNPAIVGYPVENVYE